MNKKIKILLTVGRWIFIILCLLFISLLIFLGALIGTLHWAWPVIPIALWIAAFKKKTAKWLSWGFFGCIIAIIIWLFLPNKGNWRPYNYNYLVKDLEAKRSVPDNENAAIAYEKIFDRLDTNNAPPFYNEPNEPSTVIQWKGNEHPETAEFIDARSELITEFIAASKMEKCAFPMYSSIIMDYPSSRYPNMRNIAMLIISAANRDMGEGKVNEGLEKYSSVIQMGQQLQSQTSLIELLIGVGIEALTYKQLSTVIVTNQLNSGQLDIIDKMLPTITDNYQELYSTIFEYETLLDKNMLGLMFYETNEDGAIRFRRGVPLPLRLIEEEPQAFSVINRKIHKFGSIILWFICPDDPKELSKIWDEELEKEEKVFDANQSNVVMDYPGFQLKYLKDPYRYLAQYLAKSQLPLFPKVHKTYLKIITDRRGEHILLALRKYRDANSRWPQNLDEIKDKISAEALTDPFTASPFIYHTKGNDFVLYSVGPNKIDDKGKPKPSCRDQSCEKDKSPTDDILIWPNSWKDAKQITDTNDIKL